MDYNSLIGDKTVPGSIKLWINNALIDVGTILSEAQALIYQHLRVREMIVSDYAFVMAQGDYSKPLPARFLDPIAMRDQYFVRMKARDLPSVKARRWIDATTGAIGQGQPFLFALTGTTIEFNCAADATATGTYLLDYFGAPPLLAPLNQTNFLTDRYPMLLRTACFAAAADFLNDDARVTRYTQRMMALIQDIDVNDDLAMRGSQVDADYSESRA